MSSQNKRYTKKINYMFKIPIGYMTDEVKKTQSEVITSYVQLRQSVTLKLDQQIIDSNIKQYQEKMANYANAITTALKTGPFEKKETETKPIPNSIAPVSGESAMVSSENYTDLMLKQEENEKLIKQLMNNLNLTEKRLKTVMSSQQKTMTDGMNSMKKRVLILIIINVIILMIIFFRRS